MIIVKPSFTILTPLDGEAILRHIERCGRVCYQSNHKIGDNSHYGFVLKILERGHESVLEHFSVSVSFICDRGVSHEIVRHRIASYSQESTRYCNYGHEGDITVIEPLFYSEDTLDYDLWKESCLQSEKTYFDLLENCGSPQEARSVLPNSLKTEIVMTANLREWRHFFRLRTAPNAHPQMREITKPLLLVFKEKIPVVFDDIRPEAT